MRTIPHVHRTEKVSLPRRLVPRRPQNTFVRETLAALAAPIGRFCIGDVIRYEAADGYHHFLTLLGIEPGGAVDAMIYDGQPHYIPLAVTDLVPLRIICVERMEQGDVDMYRRLLGLDGQAADEKAA